MESNPHIDNFQPEFDCSSKYMESLSRLSPDHILQFYPIYTEQFSREDLEELDLVFLYKIYRIDTPKFKLADLLLGKKTWTDDQYKINETLSKYYNLPERELSEKELYIEGLLLYYKIVNKYGRNINIYPKLQQTPESPDGPLIIQENNFSNFVEKQSKWFLEQTEQLLFFETSINYYLEHNSFEDNDGILDTVKANLISAFTLVSPLPEDIIAYKSLSEFKYSLDEVYIEKDFLKVSIKYLNSEERSKEKIKNYMGLYIPKGTILLNLTLFPNSKMEILLPPRTRFKIYEAGKIEQTNVYYSYLV